MRQAVLYRRLCECGECGCNCQCGECGDCGECGECCCNYECQLDCCNMKHADMKLGSLFESC